MGDLEGATNAIKKSIDLDPEGDYNRYLSYAQLVTGGDSRDAYKKAVSLLQSKLECLSSSDSDDASMVCATFLRKKCACQTFELGCFTSCRVLHPTAHRPKKSIE